MLVTDKKILEQFATGNRIWQGIPGIERTDKGRLFSVFYSGGVKEELGNYVVMLQSDDDGLSWSEPVCATYAGQDFRCYDATLWIDPRGRLWFFWAVMPKHAVWASVCDDPDAADLRWSDQKLVGHDVMMNKPIIDSQGRWLLPIAVWREGVAVLKDVTTEEPEGLSYIYCSKDEGETFHRLGGADVPDRQFDEHMVLEKRDGTLWMLVRTFYGIGESLSKDGGITWTPGADSGLGGPCSRFYLGRLASGNILFVNHRNFTGRNNLTAMLSRDDGQTWEGNLLLDGRPNVSYPDATEGGGFLYITYDRERGAFKKNLAEAEAEAREILMAKITEEDILAGRLVNPASRLECIISKLGKYGEDPTGLYGE